MCSLSPISPLRDRISNALTFSRLSCTFLTAMWSNSTSFTTLTIWYSFLCVFFTYTVAQPLVLLTNCSTEPPSQVRLFGLLNREELHHAGTSDLKHASEMARLASFFRGPQQHFWHRLPDLCIDIFRRSLQCNADVTMLEFYWQNVFRVASTGRPPSSKRL